MLTLLRHHSSQLVHFWHFSAEVRFPSLTSVVHILGNSSMVAFSSRYAGAYTITME